MNGSPDWAKGSGDAWAERWRETDQALTGLVPPLRSAILAAAPARPFAAFDIGCGPGSTTLDLARARPDARIVSCDLSPALIEVARDRLRRLASVEVVLGDAQQVALERGPFDLFYSRHGVMFFPDPVAAFATLRKAASDRASLVFSCFRSWDANPWASELASAAAGAPLPPPGREPSGFAFADPDYVRELLGATGWSQPASEAVTFDYVAGEGDGAVDQALSFLSAIGPASRIIAGLSEAERYPAVPRMRALIERCIDGQGVRFAASAWVWTATADARHA